MAQTGGESSSPSDPIVGIARREAAGPLPFRVSATITAAAELIASCLHLRVAAE